MEIFVEMPRIVSALFLAGVVYAFVCLFVAIFLKGAVDETLDKIEQNRTTKKDDGFSLLELVVAVGIILVLTVGGLLAYAGFINNARNAAVQSAASEVLTGAAAYQLDNKSDTNGVTAEEDWNRTSKKDKAGKAQIVVKVEELPGCLKVTATHVKKNEAIRQAGTDCVGGDSNNGNPVDPDDDSSGENGGNTNPGDENGNGIPDDEETGIPGDENGNGIPDNEENTGGDNNNPEEPTEDRWVDITQSLDKFTPGEKYTLEFIKNGKSISTCDNTIKSTGKGNVDCRATTDTISIPASKVDEWKPEGYKIKLTIRGKTYAVEAKAFFEDIYMDDPMDESTWEPTGYWYSSLSTITPVTLTNLPVDSGSGGNTQPDGEVIRGIDVFDRNYKNVPVSLDRKEIVYSVRDKQNKEILAFSPTSFDGSNSAMMTYPADFDYSKVSHFCLEYRPNPENHMPNAPALKPGEIACTKSTELAYERIDGESEQSAFHFVKFSVYSSTVMSQNGWTNGGSEIRNGESLGYSVTISTPYWNQFWNDRGFPDQID